MEERQRERERIFKQAQGARLYGYIFFSIIFPIVFWFYVILCFIVFALFLVFPSPFHISMFWVVGGIVIIILISLVFTYFLVKTVYQAIKYLRYLPLEKREELRQQFMNNELEQQPILPCWLVLFIHYTIDLTSVLVVSKWR